MSLVNGVKNPYGLIQKAGKKRRKTFRKKLIARKKTRKNRK